MNFLTLTLAVSAVLLACHSGPSSADQQEPADNSMAVSSVNSLTAEQQKDGWQLLFDGKSTKGWHKYGGHPVGTAWKVSDGMLWLDTTSKKDWQIADGGDIVTDSGFENFHLKLEWKIAPGGNSGIIFYIHEDTAKYQWPWHTGPEMQVLDNNGHPDSKITKHRAGDLYDLISCSKEMVKPAGEWNLAEIKCVNGKLEQYLNGELVVTTQLWDENWKKMVAASKFKAFPDFGTYKKGKIGLQDHGDMVWYRNIMIRNL